VWLIRAGSLLFMATLFIVLSVKLHLNPNAAHPAVELVVRVSLFASLASLGIFVCCTFGMIRRWGRGRL
jgi:hypothetical protein